MFQHTAARRRLPLTVILSVLHVISFNTQPRGGGCNPSKRTESARQGFNTQPRGGGCINPISSMPRGRSFNTQPRGGGCKYCRAILMMYVLFQHTAARRRLLIDIDNYCDKKWFQHTAARRRLLRPLHGCLTVCWFQHTAARRRLPSRN